jgi:hypothetical protein
MREDDASRAKLAQVMIEVFVDEHAVRRAGNFTEGRVRCPVAVRPALRGGMQLFPGGGQIALPLARLRRQHLGRCFRFAFGKRHDVRQEPDRNWIRQGAALEFCRHLAARDTQRVGQMADHLRRGHAAPLRFRAWRQPIEAFEQGVAVTWIENGSGQGSPIQLWFGFAADRLGTSVLLAFRQAEAARRVPFDIEFDHHSGAVPRHPSIMAGVDDNGLRRG